MIIDDLIAWVDSKIPVPCAACNRWLPKDRMVPTKMTTGHTVLLCPNCHRTLYGEMYWKP